jgi:hypothetical protein
MTKEWLAPNRIMTPHDLHLMGTSSTANRNSRNVLACQLRFNQSVPNELGWPGTDHTLSSSSSSFPVPPLPPPPSSSRLNVFFQEFLVLARMAIIHRKLAITPRKI